MVASRMFSRRVILGMVSALCLGATSLGGVLI